VRCSRRVRDVTIVQLRKERERDRKDAYGLNIAFGFEAART
jgi:hypothetical protein